jgi:DNA-binding transcriptional regulator YiaG
MDEKIEAGQRVVANDEIRKWVERIGIKRCARESNVNRYTIRSWVRGNSIPIAKARKILDVVGNHKSSEEFP